MADEWARVDQNRVDTMLGVSRANGEIRKLRLNDDGSLALDPNQAGTWGYRAGTNGTVTLSGSKRVLQITAIAQGAAGTFTINGGDTITLPYDSTDKVSSSLEIVPLGNLVDPTVIFDSAVDSYFIEFVS